MSIEIRELVIRAVVEPCDGQSGDLPGASAAERDARSEPAAPSEALVQTCVETVLRILRRERER